MKGRYSPRRFGRAAVALAALSLLFGVAITPAAQARTDAGKAAAPHRGGTLTIRNMGAPDCLDPQKTALGPSNLVDATILNSLVDVVTKNNIVPDLATSWKVSKGGTRIVFHLRHGVKFSNGDPFTANAVKFTFDRAVKPSTKSPVTGSNLSEVKNTKVVNKYTVQVNLKEPFRPLLDYFLVTSYGYVGILDPKATKREGAKSCQDPIGTGPYKVQSVGPSYSSVTVVPNKYHTWAPSWVKNKGLPYISKIVFQSITNDATAISELISGDVDISNVPGAQLNRVKNNKNIAVRKQSIGNLEALSFNFNHAPFNNLQVRRAVAELMDRSAMVKAALGGIGSAVYGPLPKTIPFYDKAAAKLMPKYNPTDAAKIISANHATGPYTLLCINDPQDTTTAQVIQTAAAQAGMQIKINSVAIADYVADANKGDFDMYLLPWGYSDADILYTILDPTQGNRSEEH